MIVDSTPLKDLNLTCEQTIRVNDCLLRATHDVHKLSFSGDNANDISEDVTSVCLQFQSVMFRSENTLEVYKSHLVPLLMKRVKIDGEDEGNEVEDHPMATVDVRYCKEIFKFYLKDLDASALLEYLISEFDWSVVDEFSSMTQLLVPYINEDKQIKGLIRFCVSRLKEMSANDTSYTDVRALVYLLSLVESNESNDDIHDFVFHLCTEGGLTKMGDEILLLCLCSLNSRPAFNKDIDAYLQKSLGSQNSLVRRRALFIYDKYVHDVTDQRLRSITRNNELYLNVFCTLDIEHEVHLFEQLLPAISKLVKGVERCTSEVRYELSTPNLLSWDHLIPLFSRFFYAADSPTIKKVAVKSFFSGDLGLDPGNIQNIPSSLIQLVLEAINSLGSNVKVKKPAKQHGHYNLLQELELFVENLVQQTGSFEIFEHSKNFKFQVTISVLEGASRGGRCLSALPSKCTSLGHLIELTNSHLENNLPQAHRDALLDCFALILKCYVTPKYIIELRPVMQVLDYDKSWTYVDLVKDWVSKCNQSVEIIFKDDNLLGFQTQELANLCCFTSRVDLALKYSYDKSDPILLHAVLKRRAPLPPIQPNQFITLTNVVKTKLFDLIRAQKDEQKTTAEICKVLVESSDFLNLMKNGFDIKVDSSDLIQEVMRADNILIRALGLYCALSYSKTVKNLQCLVEDIAFVDEGKLNGLLNGNNEKMMYNICKWGILSKSLPQLLAEKAPYDKTFCENVLSLADVDLVKVPIEVFNCCVQCFQCILLNEKEVVEERMHRMMEQILEHLVYLKSTTTAKEFSGLSYSFVDMLSSEKLWPYQKSVYHFFKEVVQLGYPGTTRKLLASFSPLWLQRSETLKLYQDWILKFATYKEEKVEPVFANKDLAFESTHLNTLEQVDYYSLNRSIILVFFSQLSSNGNDDVTNFVKWIVLHLLKMGASDVTGNHSDNLLIGSAPYSLKIRAWQALYVLCPLVPLEETYLKEMLPLIGQSMKLNLHNKIRYFMEIFLMKLVKRWTSTNDNVGNPAIDWLLNEISSPTLSIQHISSLMIVIGWLLTSNNFPKDVLTLKRLLCYSIPWLGATQGFTRGIAQLLVHELSCLIDLQTNNDDLLLKNLFFFLKNNKDMQKLRSKQSRFFSNHKVEHTVSSLLTLPVDESNEATPTSLVEIIEDSLRECYHEKYSIDNCEMDVDVPLWKQLQRMTLIDMTSSSSVKSNQDANEDNFQRKIIPIDLLQLTIAEGLKSSSLNSAGFEKQSLIICASLIDKIPNLAGLTRTAEIFAAEKIVIPNRAIIRRDDFKSMSVGAGDHIDIEECRVEHLMGWLGKMRNEKGYKIVGIEQTSSSVSITDLKFPPKVVILLGKEKEGIPVEFLDMIDVCVEIPQFGIIRSLNVHVSGALAIWDYTKQQLLANTDVSIEG